MSLIPKKYKEEHRPKERKNIVFTYLYSSKKLEFPRQKSKTNFIPLELIKKS